MRRFLGSGVAMGMIGCLFCGLAHAAPKPPINYPDTGESAHDSWWAFVGAAGNKIVLQNGEALISVAWYTQVERKNSASLRVCYRVFQVTGFGPRDWANCTGFNGIP